MNSVSLTGSDTIQIDQRILNDLADADAVMISFPNDKTTVKVGKNGNTIYAKNEMGALVECVIRVLAGSSDDQYLNSRMAQQDNGFSDFILLTGVFVKRVGDGTGGTTGISSIVYPCFGGVFKKAVEAKTSAEGDTEQSAAVYHITFKLQTRSIQ